MDRNKRREEILGQRGLVVWLTGLPGSGKSTIAIALEEKLLEIYRPACVLDGDIVRSGLNSDLGFSDDDRNENIRRIAEVAAILKDISLVTIVAFISPFARMREFARQRAGRDAFMEVWVKASLETCISRDPKGMYRKALEKQISEFTGITSAYEEPENPDMVIDTEKLTVEESVSLLLDAVMKRIITRS
jgi:adenylylsulfate kinase